MSHYKFFAAQRYAVFAAHRERCWLCDEPVALRDMDVDHILPETLEGTDRLAEVANQLSLPEAFRLNSYENWMPAHRTCNETKNDQVFKPTPMIQLRLQRAAERAPKAREIERKYLADRTIDRAIEQILIAAEQGNLSNESRNRLAPLIKQVTAFHDSNRLPEDRGSPLLLAPRLEIIREDASHLWIRGPAGIGARPKGRNLHPSWDCPHCGVTGWNGARCVSCGHVGRWRLNPALWSRLRQRSAPSPVELRVKTRAHRRASQRHEVIVLARLARPAEIGRAGAQEAMVDAVAFQVHEFATGRI